MGSFTAAASAEQRSGERPRNEELEPGRKAARPVPAAKPVAREERAAARPWEPQHVLEIRGRGSCRADSDAVERAAPEREERQHGRAAHGLEPPRRDVLVRHAVTEQVRAEAEEERRATGRRCLAHGASRRDVQRDDQRSPPRPGSRGV